MRYQLSPTVRVRKGKQKIYIYDYKTDEFFELNLTAWLILELLEQYGASEAVARRLAVAYSDQTEQELKQDVEELLLDLVNKGILTAIG